MIEIIVLRTIIVLVQLAFIVGISRVVDLNELGRYYEYLAYAFVFLSLVISYPEYVFQRLVSKREINRGKLKSFCGLTLLVVLLVITASIIIESLFAEVLAFLLLLSSLNLIRLYLNVISLKRFVLHTQIIEGLLRLLALAILCLFLESLTGKALVRLQIISSSTILFGVFWVTLRNKKARRLGLKKSGFNFDHKQVIYIVFNTAVNALYTNFIKIYLGWTNSENELGLFGLAQQLSSNLAQSINAILQIQYGNQVLRGAHYLKLSVLPSIAFFLLGVSLIAVATNIVFPQIESNLMFVSFSLFLLVFAFEYYIVPLSFLVKHCIRQGKIGFLVKLHTVMAATIVLATCLLYSYSGIENALIIGIALTIFYSAVYVRSARNV